MEHDYTVTKVRTAKRGEFFDVRDVTFASVHWGGILIASVDTEEEALAVVKKREKDRELIDQGITPKDFNYS